MEHQLIKGFILGAMVIGVACAAATLDPDGPQVGLPNRSQPPDLSRVNDAFRATGGNAFVRLTGRPTSAAIDALAHSGLRPPTGCEKVLGFECTTIMTFDSLAIPAVAGQIPAHGVDRIAQLKFVTAIEPSADIIQ